MKIFTLKVLIVSLVFYLIFELTIGSRIDKAEDFLQKFNNKGERIKIKNKILFEMEKANKKDEIFKDSEKKILSDFIKKIQKELNSQNN
tara:strand:- start:4 stop:270 length:267 start_codon:yes stop_codon:yes gene_type:complete